MNKVEEGIGDNSGGAPLAHSHTVFLSLALSVPGKKTIEGSQDPDGYGKAQYSFVLMCKIIYAHASNGT